MRGRQTESMTKSETAITAIGNSQAQRWRGRPRRRSPCVPIGTIFGGWGTRRRSVRRVNRSRSGKVPVHVVYLALVCMNRSIL